jgi:hypothetical protein
VNVAELARLLVECSIPPHTYSLNQDSDEAHCLVRDGDGWIVYYSQRGHRDYPLTFVDESNACRALIERLLSDTTNPTAGHERLREVGHRRG